MMLIKIIWGGLKESLRFKWMAGFILLIQILLTSLIGVLTFYYVQGAIGHSTNLLKIIEGYNHDVFQDLLRFENTGWTMIKMFFLAILVLYFFIGPFIMGGLLFGLKRDEDNWQSFWNGGSKFYFPFLKLNLIVAGITLAILGSFIAIAIFLFNYGILHFPSEIPTLIGIGILLVLFIVILIILVSTSTHTKWTIINGGKNVWKQFKKNLRLVRARGVFFTVLGFAFLVISFGFAFLINLVINCIPESGFLLVILALALQIFALFSRIGIRNAYYFSILSNRRSKESDKS